jgi:hypothetical protein
MKIPLDTWSRFYIDRVGLAVTTRSVCRVAGVPGPGGMREQVRDIVLADGSPGPDAPIAASDIMPALLAIGTAHVEIVYDPDNGCTANDQPYEPDAQTVAALTALFDDIAE